MTYNQAEYTRDLPEVKQALQILNIIHCTQNAKETITRNITAQIKISGLTATAQNKIVSLCKEALLERTYDENDRLALENFILRSKQ